MAKGIDCATKLTKTTATAIKKAGYDYVMRYLGTNWKTVQKDEADAILDAGLTLVPVYETNPTSAGYFSHAQGVADGKAGSQYAHNLGIPKGVAIYFTVDYDAQSGDMRRIIDYFQGVAEGIDKAYHVGVYGSYAVVEKMKPYVQYYWQTYAWSGGRRSSIIHMHQYLNDQKVAGVVVDLNDILKDPAGWKKSVVKPKPAEKPKPAAKPKSSTYTIKKGDTFWGLEEKNGWKHGTLQALNPSVNAKALKIGSKIKVPSSGKTTSKPAPAKKYHTVVPGDVLSVIAQNNGITLAAIKKLNPQIKNPDLIHPGEKVRVK